MISISLSHLIPSFPFPFHSLHFPHHILILHLFISFWTAFRIQKMRSALSVRSYSVILFGFCLIFLIFGYRSLRSNKNEDFAQGNGLSKKLKERFSKLKVKTCSEISRIGEFGLCSIQMINKARNCLVFSVATQTDLKFEMEIAERLSKCKVRVYDHEAKATNSDGQYRVVEKLDTESIDEKVLKKIIDTEKGKIHVLRLEAGDRGNQLARSKLLKDRSVCHLLLTLYNIKQSELELLLVAMEKDQGYKLYSVRELKNEEGDQQEEEENEEEEEEMKTDNGARNGDEGEEARHYSLSLIAQHCQKNYGIKEK